LKEIQKEKMQISIRKKEEKAKNKRKPSNKVWMERERKLIGRFISNKKVHNFYLFLTLINVIVLCMDHNKIDKDWKKGIYLIDYSGTIFFFAELSLKIFSFGMKEQFKSSANVLDFCLITINLMEMGIELERGTWKIDEVFAMSAIKSLKIIRIFKYFILTNKMESLGVLFTETLNVLKATKEFLLTVLVFIVILAFIGRELFAHTVRYDLHEELNL
jgi:hypothetical protein